MDPKWLIRLDRQVCSRGRHDEPTPAADINRLWHPFSDISKVAGHEFVLDRAEGVWLWDRDGQRYLDATSSLWYANIGHRRARMAEAIAAQIRKLDAYSTFGDQANEPATGSPIASPVCRRSTTRGCS